MFRFDETKSYMMPGHFGARPIGRATGYYHDVTAMIITYLTDRGKLAECVPEPFEVGEEPLVSVIYAMNKEVDWLAGHSYNLIGVNASVVFNGKTDRLAGFYTLVMWENLTDPILFGRELQGIPKVFADIQDHCIVHGEWRTVASHFGHKIVEMMINNLRPLTTEEIDAWQRQMEGKDHWMGWRYIPTVGGPGAALSEPTLFPYENTIREAMIGEGEVIWQRLTWEQNPTQYHIVNALADLPILEHRMAVVTKGSNNLVIAHRPPRVLI
jgi:hypothetical protein